MLLFHSITSKLFNNKKIFTNIKLLAAPKKKDENTPTPPVKRGPGTGRPPGSNNKNPSTKNGTTTGSNNNNGSSEPPEKRSKVDQSGKQEAVTPLTSLQVNIMKIVTLPKYGR